MLSVSQERVTELSRLAQEVVKVDKYRSETCSVLGTYVQGCLKMNSIVVHLLLTKAV